LTVDQIPFHHGSIAHEEEEYALIEGKDPLDVRALSQYRLLHVLLHNLLQVVAELEALNAIFAACEHVLLVLHGGVANVKDATLVGIRLLNDLILEDFDLQVTLPLRTIGHQTRENRIGKLIERFDHTRWMLVVERSCLETLSRCQSDNVNDIQV